MEHTLLGTADVWLANFEQAIAGTDATALENLFHPDGYWRDLLAFTWHIQTTRGGANIAGALKQYQESAKAVGFKIDGHRTAPRLVTRAGIEAIEAIFAFETAHGRASGVFRLIRNGADNDAPKAWTLLTALDEITCFEETDGRARPTGEAYARDFHGPNWLDHRQTAVTYADRDPAVLIVGGGHAGLSLAACLTQLGVDALIVDREERIGDNWRKRYHALTLHNRVHVNHFPYMPFPPNWPSYIPKDKLAGWFEAYTESMELNFWTGTEFTAGSYDEPAGKWSVGLKQADGKTRNMQPRHVVMAASVSGIPNVPEIAGLENFAGKVLHSSQFGHGAEWAGAKIIIIGTGNSGHDIAQDLHANGAHVTMVQRSPTTINNVEPSAQLPYALYDEGPNLADCDLIASSMPFPLMAKSHQLISEQTKLLDAELLDGLHRVGFKTDFGADNTGWQFKYLRQGGGYYFNVGCSDLLIDGRVGLIQFDDIDAFLAGGVRLGDGRELAADLIILATGFKGPAEMVQKFFGDGVAGRVGRIWGIDPELHELRNMWVRTGQPGLWFTAGSFAQCRIYSKYLAMQIKAREEGLISAAKNT